MRRLLVLMAFCLVLAISSIVGGAVVLSTSFPIPASSPLFPIQESVEQVRLHLTSDSYERIQYLLIVADHRLTDLEARISTLHSASALYAFDQTIVQLVEYLAGFHPTESIQQVNIDTAIESLLLRTNAILESQNKFMVSNPALSSQIVALSEVLTAVLEDPSSVNHSTDASTSLPIIMKDQQSDPNTSSTIDPMAVFFPPGSAGARHEFYPLVGKHALLECQSCHAQGVYAGTNNTCESCHASIKPELHYPGSCSACHSPVSWVIVDFDHAVSGATDCQNCHESDEPSGHFSGQCSACHNTVNWNSVSFNHAVANALDCQGCHAVSRPANHFGGQCSACHSTSAWQPASFNHAAVNADDCQSCHSNDDPPGHFNGQCSGCHSTSAWMPADFNHQAAGAFDCQNCHNGSKPSNHFEGQCSACHSTKAWKPASFDHSSVGGNCQSCHTGSKPANHFEGQCSACHSTNAWKPASFDHASAGGDCQSCHSGDRPGNHFAGQCSQCHSTNAWKPASFDHASVGGDCLSCHSGDRPGSHFDGQCSQCHNTSSWGGASFDHSFPTNHGGANNDCGACHTSPNWDWTCYTCHNQNETEKHHAEKDIFNIAQRCLECHPNGEED